MWRDGNLRRGPKRRSGEIVETIVVMVLCRIEKQCRVPGVGCLPVGAVTAKEKVIVRPKKQRRVSLSCFRLKSMDLNMTLVLA